MAEANSSTTPTVESNGSSKDKRKKGGLITFIKKNKTLSAVAGVGGLYFLYKMNTEKSANSGEPEGEISEISNESGALAGTAQAAAFELGRSERLAEQSHSEVEEIEAEREDERKRVKEKEREKEEEEAPGTGESPGAGGGGTTGGEAEPTNPGGGGVTIHGRTFSGARSSHIAKTGKTSGGKAYVEYAIQFAGRVEHWQYFTATGNWRRVADSSSGGGANKPGPGNNSSPDHHPAGGPATDRKKKRKPVGVGPAKPVSSPAPAPKPPSTNPVHPQAVNTGNRCVNGGVGGHTAPPGYHLFCQNGWIWRAPNS